MPGQNGIEFLETVREDFPDLPFILYTGKGSEVVASDAIHAGVTDYLQKESGTSQYEVLANRIQNAVEQRRAQEAAAETEQRLRTIAENTNDVLWKFTADWDELLFVNSPYEEIWGRSIDDLREQPHSFTEGIHSEDRPQVEDAMERLSAGESVDIEYRMNADGDVGRWVWMQGNPVFDDAGEVEEVVGFARDITDRKEREQELRETSRRLDLALAATDTGVWEWNMETDEVVWSEALERLLGIEPGTFGGTFEAHAEYVHPDDIPTVEQSIDDALDGDGTFRAEFRMHRQDGEQIWVAGRGELLARDGPQRMIGTTTDITDRKEGELALARREMLDPSIELEFHSDQIAQTVLNQSESDLEVLLDGVVSQSDGTQLLYGTVRGPIANEIQAVLDAIPTVGETRLLSTVGDSARFEVSAEAGSIAAVFATFGGELQSLVTENGTCRLVGEFPEIVDPEAVTQAVRETYPDLELASQRRIVIPAYLRSVIEDNLTERQRTVLGMAYYAGYFEQPRRSTGEELADKLGITRQTFNSHLRKALSTVFHAVFEEAVELPG